MQFAPTKLSAGWLKLYKQTPKLAKLWVTYISRLGLRITMSTNMLTGVKMTATERQLYRPSASGVRKALSSEGIQNVRIPSVAQNVIKMNWIVEALLCAFGVSSTTIIENFVVRPFSENLISQIKSSVSQITENRVKCGSQVCDGFFAKNEDYCRKCNTTISSEVLPRNNITGKYEKGLMMVTFRLVPKVQSAFKAWSQWNKYDACSNWCVVQVKQRKGVFINNESVWQYAGVTLWDAYNMLTSLDLDTSDILRLKGDSWFNNSGKKKTCFRTVVFATCGGVEVAVDEAYISSLEADKIPYRYQPSAEYLGGLNQA